MGQQIIKHPNGGYAVWSTIIDDWLFSRPLTLEQLVAWQREEVAAAAEASVRFTVAQLDLGQKAYSQFTKTFDEAETNRKVVHGRRSSMRGRKPTSTDDPALLAAWARGIVKRTK